MAVITGELGCVDGIGSVRNWMVRTGADHKVYRASNTNRGPGRRKGNVDWSGRAECTGYQPVKMVRDAFDFTGSVNGAKGVKGACLVDSVEIAIGQEAGDLIQHTIEFSGNGQLAKDDASVVADVTVPDPPTSIDCIVQIADCAGAPAYAALDEVRSVRLRFSADNKARNTSTTGRYTNRTVGNWDMELSIEVFGDDLSALPGEEDEKFVKVFVSDILFWEFNAILFGEQSDLLVDPENDEPIGCTLNGGFTGFYDVGGTATEGKLVLPDTNNWWPFA